MRNPLAKRNALDSSPTVKAVSYVLLIAWALVVLFPLYWLVVTSLKTPLQVVSGPFYLPGVDFNPTLENWEYLLVANGKDTFRPYLNTTIVAFASATVALILGALAAYGLVRFRYAPRIGLIALGGGVIVFVAVATGLGTPPAVAIAAAVGVFLLLVGEVSRRFRRTIGNGAIAFWMITQRLMPPVAIVIPVYVFFQTIHMLDSQIALITTYAAANLPIVVWLMRDYFQSVPEELEEAALVDGASPFRVLRSIVLPVSAPGLVATFLLVLIFAWNEYLLALFLSSANSQTMPMLLAAQNATKGPQWWYMSALILMMIMPVIVMAILLERYIERGLLAGAVKG